MRVLDRLVAGQFLKLFGISILATPPLFILGELTEDLDRYVDLGLTGAEVARGFLFRVPEYFVWSFPIAGLIAAVFTVHAMTAHREIVAAKAGGVSFHRLVVPIFILGAVLSGVGLGLTDVVPRSNKIAFQTLRDSGMRRDWRTNLVHQTEHGLTLGARRLTMADRRLTGVLIQERQGEDGSTMHVQAASAFHNGTEWTFLDGLSRFVERDGSQATYRFERMRLPSLATLPEDLLDDPPEDDEMTYEELDRMAGLIERSGGEAHELRVRKEQRRAIPLATLVVILFGVPMATSSKRGGNAYGIGVALGTTILYLLLLQISGGLGSAGAISPVVAAWIPNGLFLVAGLGLMTRVRT